MRHFNIDRALVLEAGFDAAHDLGRGAVLIQQNGRRDRYLVVHAALGFECLDLVVQQRVFLAILAARRAADDDHRRFLGVGAGDRVQYV